MTAFFLFLQRTLAFLMLKNSFQAAVCFICLIFPGCIDLILTLCRKSVNLLLQKMNKMKKNVWLLSFVGIILMAFQEPAQGPVELKKTKIGDHISAKVPESFMLAGEQALSEKYLTGRPPLALFTSPDGQVDFSVNLSANQWQHFDLPLAKDFYKASLSSLYSGLEMINEEIKEVNGHQMAVFEYIGTVEGEQSAVRKSGPVSKYTYIGYVMVNGKVVVLTFTAPAKQQQQWAPVAEEMLSSLKIKKTL